MLFRSKLCTVFDLHMQNENTEKDVSPFPDQDTIQHDVACAAYRSKLDMSEAYIVLPRLRLVAG